MLSALTPEQRREHACRLFAGQTVESMNDDQLVALATGLNSQEWTALSTEDQDGLLRAAVESSA